MVPEPHPAAPLTRPADAPPTVALVRSDNVRGAVAEALALLDGPIRAALAPPVVATVVPGRDRSGASALSAVLDVVLSAVPGEVIVASGAPGASDRFARLGYAGECWNRPVRLLDLPRDESDWLPDGPARVSGTVARAGSRVAIIALDAARRGDAPPHRSAALDAIHPDNRMLDRSDSDSAIDRARPGLVVLAGRLGWRGRRAAAVAGLDPVAVDATAARLLGTSRRWAPSLAESARRGWGTADPSRIAVVGDGVDRAGVRGRRVDRGARRPVGSSPLGAAGRRPERGTDGRPDSGVAPGGHPASPPTAGAGGP